MKEKLKRIIPDRYKVTINKILKPVRFLEYLLNKDKYQRKCKEMGFKFYTDVETVNQIIEEKKSLARFGDGELRWILNMNYGSYQRNDKRLSKRLINVLKSSNENLIIGLPNVFSNEHLNKYTIDCKVFWVNFICKFLPLLEKYIEKDKVYADTQISRCYIDYKEKAFAGERYSNVKRIWQDREIVIVEGSKTKMGVGNDLLSNAKSISRVICPSTNAFDKYDEIFSYIQNNCKNKLILLSLGPTATILASDISKIKTTGNDYYQAIDLGHLDVEYEWYKMKAKKRKAIKGKFVNEVRTEDLSNINQINEEYEKSIVMRIE